MMLATHIRSAKEQLGAKPAAASGDTSLEVRLKQVIGILDDYKALDVTVIPLAGKATFADFMLIATGTSTRHVSSMGNALDQRMASDVMGCEGMKDGEWACIDMHDIVIHLFVPEKRKLYNLEKLWSHTFDEVDEA